MDALPLVRFGLGFGCRKGQGMWLFQEDFGHALMDRPVDGAAVLLAGGEVADQPAVLDEAGRRVDVVPSGCVGAQDGGCHGGPDFRPGQAVALGERGGAQDGEQEGGGDVMVAGDPCEVVSQERRGSCLQAGAPLGVVHVLRCGSGAQLRGGEACVEERRGDCLGDRLGGLRGEGVLGCVGAVGVVLQEGLCVGGDVVGGFRPVGSQVCQRYLAVADARLQRGVEGSQELVGRGVLQGVVGIGDGGAAHAKYQPDGWRAVKAA
ncbi:hypothetical protein ACFU99_12885 [Streptomyces sp. NPDC057654]|uniref:hypothetical protein n=1 Tax=Streptomyces sp. NPDC057654 TaxID=3346196 RepID=UPI0036A98008